MTDPLPTPELPPLEERPLVTFALFAYNQEKYIREAVEGAFAQTYEPLEIIFSDDCSTDRTFKIMQEMSKTYRGPHQVRLNRNETNLHVGGHVAKMADIACGEILVMAAGDDVSLPERTSYLVARFLRKDKPSAVFSNMRYIDDQQKHLYETRYPYTESARITLSEIVRRGGGVGAGAAYAYRKECFFKPWSYPTFYLNEDRLLPLRAALINGVSFERRTLVKYRHTATGFFRGKDQRFVMAKYNQRYMNEIAKTIKAAHMSTPHWEINLFFFEQLAKLMPFISLQIYYGHKNLGFFGKLYSKLIYCCLWFDKVPSKLTQRFFQR